MRGTVTFIFNPRQSLDIDLDVQIDPEVGTQARQWLETTWEQLGCEPLRPSGKVLLLDKILGVADAYGYTTLSTDTDKQAQLARMILQAVQAQRVTVDLPGLTVGF